jgi:hypothetical protein
MATMQGGKAKKGKTLSSLTNEGKTQLSMKEFVLSAVEINDDSDGPPDSKHPRKPVKEKEWIWRADEHNRSLQRLLCIFGVSAYAFALVCTFIIILLNGFHAHGFSISEGFLKWLGGATVGEVGGLVVLLVKLVFKKK